MIHLHFYDFLTYEYIFFKLDLKYIRRGYLQNLMPIVCVIMKMMAISMQQLSDILELKSKSTPLFTGSTQIYANLNLVTYLEILP